MSQQNKNTNQNNENLDEDRIPFDEEEPDAAELYGTIRTFHDKDGKATMTECFL